MNDLGTSKSCCSDLARAVCLAETVGILPETLSNLARLAASWDLSTMSLRARRGPAPALVSLVLACVVFLLGARPARAWVDVNVEGDDVRLTVAPSGEVRVEHRITLKIAGGPLRAIDVRGVDRDAVPEADGYVVPQREALANSLASAVPIATEMMPPGNSPEADGSPALPVLRIRFQNDRGLGRGVYVILVRYGSNLANRITLDGAMARVTWRGPLWSDGLDSARVTFDFPAAPNEPRLDESPLAPSDVPPTAAGNAAAPVTLSTLRRSVTRDAIELMRPYAPKGERITWAVRADARALRGALPDPSRNAAVPVVEDGLAAPAQRALVLGAALAIFVLYSILVARKSSDVARAAEAAGATARPLVPLPAVLRALLAGTSLVGGLAIELVLHRATLGAILVLAATIFAAHLPAAWKAGARLRGPGRWLPVAEAEAFRDPPRAKGGYLDASTRAGLLTLLLVLAVVAGGVYLLSDISPYQAQILAFDTTAILAIFGTGLRSSLPPDPGSAPASFLRRVAGFVRRTLRVDPPRIVGRIRVPEGSTEPDELRLAIAPRAAIAGFVTIEIGVIHIAGAGGSIALPEVLLRVTDGSECDRALQPLSRHGRSMRGRKPGERVYAFSPRLPTARMTANLVSRLARAVAAPAAQESAPRPTAASRKAA